MRERSFILRASVLMALLFFTFSLCSQPADFKEKNKKAQRNVSTSQALGETSIRNDTQNIVQYIIQPDRPGEKPEKKAIQAGYIDRYPGDVALKLIFHRDEKPLIYRLNPGGIYSFRLDDQYKLDVYADINKKADMEDIVPFVATSRDVVRKMLEMAQVGEDDIVYDLGCGDGRIVILAAEGFGARGVGIDLDPRRVKESRANAKASGVENRVEFRLQDALKTDFSEATVVTLYMLMEINELLRPQLEKQLKRGTYIVTHSYPIPGWASKQIDFVSMTTADDEEHFIYLYRR